MSAIKYKIKALLKKASAFILIELAAMGMLLSVSWSCPFGSNRARVVFVAVYAPRIAFPAGRAVVGR